MRLSICAAAIASAFLIERCIAVPFFFKSSAPKLSDQEVKDIEAARKQEEEALKYFHEPGGDDETGHYDSRYYHGLVTDEERTDTQAHMIRAYLEFFRENNMDTWIAHGTLLGWWWNGKRLPWDFDLDTQVSHATLSHLGQKYNGTRYAYTSPSGTVHRSYLLDVNPWIWQRVRGDGMNVIDARWIDVRNGLFIDITGLSETRPDTAPGVWWCKNYHQYKVEDLYPMRETMFEGVVATVPYEYEKMIGEEYRWPALVNREFNGHFFDLKTMEWVKTEETIKIDEEKRKTREGENKKRMAKGKQLD